MPSAHSSGCSFQYSQTSIRSGNVLGMGKGFWCSDVVRGHDLGDVIIQACQRAVREPLTDSFGWMLMIP